MGKLRDLECRVVQVRILKKEEEGVRFKGRPRLSKKYEA
jgi:hypothetical protein